MIQSIHDAIAAALGRRSLDRRTCFTDVRANPPGARTIVVECSDADLLDELRERLSVAVADRDAELVLIALPEPGAGLPEVFVASASVVDVRRQAAHSAELVTQLVCGDAVSPLKRDGDWILVRLDDGYIGWVRSWHLTPRARREHDAADRSFRHRVRDNVIAVYQAPDEASRPVSDAVAGTPVRVEPCERRGWRRVTLPDGTSGFAEAKRLETRLRFGTASSRGPHANDRLRGKLAATALRFLGIPYVWGGTTPKGFDCSGLTQRIFRLHGIMIPRDSDMQARFRPAREAGNASELRAGELLFFGGGGADITHVAMSLSNGLFVHAHGQVRLNSLLPDDPLFDGRLADIWCLASDPLQP